MSTNEPTDRQSIARNQATDRPCVIGVDGEGATHFFSRYDRVIVVVGDEIETFALDARDNPIADLSDWQTHVESKRGWEDCRVTSSSLIPAGGL